jgi:glycosyltransferase involved in cell wall biosynthesis
MTISLVLATISRTVEVSRFLDTLARQTYRDFELIIVDQNSDDRLTNIINQYSNCICIRHLRSKAGLSLSRNTGLAHAQGNIVGFPDDDCWYPDNLLSNVVYLFQQDSSRQALTGWYVDPDNKNYNSNILRETPGRVSFYTPMKWGSTISLFIRREVTDVIGFFNINLGPGSGTKLGSGEDTDFLLRILSHGIYTYFDSNRICVFHEYKTNVSIEGIERARKYNYCTGFLLRYHRLPWLIVGRFLLRPLFGCLKSIVQIDPLSTRFFWAVLSGRLAGFLLRFVNAQKIN